MNFKAMHQQSTPLLIGNAWDVASAHAVKQAGYLAVGTSSAAIASMFGYADGEGLSFAELQQLVTRMAAACDVPLSVDMEAGYADEPEQVAANLHALATLGVVGVNLEDSLVRRGKRHLLDAEVFAARLAVITAKLAMAGTEMFLNVRTDTFLLGDNDAQAETIRRGQLYADAGADGLFVPCVIQTRDIAAIVEAVPLPLNVMCMPELPAFDRLAELGVKRISMGNFVYSQLQLQLVQTLQAIRTQQSFAAVFEHAGH
jgi:2-methylisocitrate lyase-like PEP mutase family enzyme